MYVKDLKQNPDQIISATSNESYGSEMPEVGTRGRVLGPRLGVLEGFWG